jgi:HD-GYP domain-containing protein (c-di-GMP phosphodiesterase class II)
MGNARIVLAGLGPRLQGLRWEWDRNFRIGRQDNADIVLQDLSVSRLQAEVQLNGGRWAVRDLADHPRHPTLVNGARVGPAAWHLKPGDLLQCGNLGLRVEAVEGARPEPAAPPPDPALHVRTSGTVVRVQATASHSWDQALRVVALDRQQRPQEGQHLLTLLRTGYHLGHIGCLDELLQSILEDALAALGAQRGALVLADATGRLQLRAELGPGLPPGGRGCYSRTLAQRCFRQGESMLCQDVRSDDALVTATSIMRGSMASIICALLRSPRQRLGVLHLDRGPFQEPFTQEDFFLADAIAASVAVGIESAQLVERQREEFVQTVTSLARAVELRDQYTGDHTRRVTDYALVLADELRLAPGERYQIQLGTPLHDIGKIGVDDAILRKPGKLTPGEFEVMKTHTLKGAHILESIANLNAMIPIVRHHHERWDGGGYPDRLAGEQISHLARIVAVADAFDAMTSDRPYRPALTADRAFHELASKAGSHFDPRCVEAFLRQRPRIEELQARRP